MHRSRLMTIWSNLHQDGKCKFCKQPIVWITTNMGKRLPFEPGFKAIGSRVDEGGRRFDTVSSEHFHACPKKPSLPGMNR